MMSIKLHLYWVKPWLELAEQLKKKLTVGLLVNTSEIVLSTTIEDLHQNTSANVYYKSFGGSPTLSLY